MGLATDMMMTGRFVDAGEAERSRLVSRVVPENELNDAVRTLAESLERTVPATLHEYSLLAKDARRTVGDISRVVRELEKNPSQIMWGRQQQPQRAPATR